jgi:hypothetical protein
MAAAGLGVEDLDGARLGVDALQPAARIVRACTVGRTPSASQWKSKPPLLVT